MCGCLEIHLSANYTLSPGMPVQAEVITGKSSVAEYFLSPIEQYKDESIKER